jgi:hypothetical protein
MDGEWKALKAAIEVTMVHLQNAYDLLQESRKWFPCDHPEEECEVLSSSTMGNLKYRCKLCGRIIEHEKGRGK